MLQLPKGYYAVQSNLDQSQADCFTYQGVTYTAIQGVNLFATLSEANEMANELPEVILEGLPYERFSTPVLLFSEGRHCIDKFVFDKSLTLLGQGAGVNPNIPSMDPEEAPDLNPARREGESVLYGSYWWGSMKVEAADIERVIIDGFSSEYVRFRDLRKEGGRTSISIRNIIHISPCGFTLYYFLEPDSDSGLDREIQLRNIRVTEYDDLDYGGNFLQVCGGKVTLDGICYDTSCQIFGLTTISRNHSNCQTNVAISEYVITNSYFRNLKGEHGISTGCCNAGERAVNLTVRDSVFVNASREHEAPLRPHLPNERCRLRVFGCTFVDRRKNNGSAISILGPGTQVEIHDNRFDGFEAEWEREREVPITAPDYIKCLEEGSTTGTDDPHEVMEAACAGFQALDAIYEGTKAYYGDLHVHTACGGTSDGAYPMDKWPAKMDEMKLDFAAVVDHRQMRGFFLPEWDEERFIIGTEPGTAFLDLNACRHGQRSVHYNMLFPHKYGLAMVLANFPEFEFHGDELTGTFKYPHFTKARFSELTRYVQSIGGMMVHPHPKTMLSSDDPLDYYFGEHMYLETLYEGYMTHESFKNYDLWVKLLALGKHVYTACGSDTHGDVSNRVVATFYTREKSGKAFFDQMHSGDFTAGAVGMKMGIFNNSMCYPMGSEIAYEEGQMLLLRLDDFYEPAWKPNTAYELRIYTDQGLAYASIYNGKFPQAVALKVQKRLFYRAEVMDLTHGYRVAIGNPIWLDG